MTLTRLVKADSQILKDINRLLLQLSSSGKQATLSHFKKVLAQKNIFFFVMKDKGHVIAMGTLISESTIFGNFGQIEDVVVDEAYRGKGLGEKIMRRLIAEAKKLKLEEVGLTSRPSRVAANALYKKLGFSQRETNVYDLTL